MMTDPYKLAATPFLIAEGEFRGELKGAKFVATSATDTKQWFAISCGHFEASFSKLVPPQLAREMIAALIHGDDVAFPGLYQEKQFDHGFLYEASPVYFELPPSIGPVNVFCDFVLAGT